MGPGWLYQDQSEFWVFSLKPVAFIFQAMMPLRTIAWGVYDWVSLPQVLVDPLSKRAQLKRLLGAAVAERVARAIQLSAGLDK